MTFTRSAKIGRFTPTTMLSGFRCDFRVSWSLAADELKQYRDARNPGNSLHGSSLWYHILSAQMQERRATLRVAE